MMVNPDMDCHTKPLQILKKRKKTTYWKPKERYNRNLS